MKLKFRHAGPERETSIELPPKAPWIGDYVLAFDEERERTLYIVSPDFHTFGETYAFDGEAFERLSGEAIRTESPDQRWQGFYDPSRKGVVGWNFCKDDNYDAIAVGVRYAADGPVLVPTRGEGPARDEDADEAGALFAYDRKRDVTVCLSQLGVWELDTDGAWLKKRDGRGIPTEDWKEECFGAAWDAKAGVCRFWMVAEDDDEDDRFWMFAWDGETLDLRPNDGMPEGLVTGWMNTGPVGAGHPDAGIVAYCGTEHGMLAFDGDAWTAFGTTSQPAPASTQAKMSWDPRLGAFILGPGDYEPAPGDFPEEQRLFYVGIDGEWTKLGITRAESEIKSLWSKRFGSFVGGRYRAMGNFYLTLLEWSDDGWTELLDKRSQQKLWDGGGTDAGTHALIGMVDADGETLAVSNQGHVFRWSDGQWTEVHGESPLFKLRMWASLCWDPQAKQIVCWGGQVKGRKSNDTLFFKLGTWSKAKGKSPKPAGFARKKGETQVEWQLYWDTKLERVVRVGFEETGVLEGDKWVAHSPEGLSEMSISGRAIAHDPRSGKTLGIDFEKGVLFEIGLDACRSVGTLELPHDLHLPEHVDEAYGYRCLSDDWAFDPTTRLLHVQNPDDKWGHYVLDLSRILE